MSSTPRTDTCECTSTNSYDTYFFRGLKAINRRRVQFSRALRKCGYTALRGRYFLLNTLAFQMKCMMRIRESSVFRRMESANSAAAVRYLTGPVGVKAGEKWQVHLRVQVLGYSNENRFLKADATQYLTLSTYRACRCVFTSGKLTILQPDIPCCIPLVTISSSL